MSAESSLLELCRTEEIYLKFRLSERLRVGDASREWAESSLLELCRAKEIYLKFRLSERLRVGDASRECTEEIYLPCRAKEIYLNRKQNKTSAR